MKKYLSEGGKAISDCIDCGQCESKCPQNLEIRKQLRRVEEALTKI